MENKIKEMLYQLARLATPAISQEDYINDDINYRQMVLLEDIEMILPRFNGIEEDIDLPSWLIDWVKKEMSKQSYKGSKVGVVSSLYHSYNNDKFEESQKIWLDDNLVGSSVAILQFNFIPEEEEDANLTLSTGKDLNLSKLELEELRVLLNEKRDSE